MLLTAREQVIADVCDDLFTRYMSRPRNERLPLDREAANTLLLSCLFNRQIGWQKAMDIVPELKRRTGYRDTLAMMTELTEPILSWVMFVEKPSLHRFHYMADLGRGCMLTVRDRYDGDARNIFYDPKSPDGTITGTDALARVLAIKGFGSKTGSLYLRMATLVYSQDLYDGTMSLMPADDRWVKRVGAQLGLWEEDASFKTICEVAKRLCYTCPAAVDSLFVLGTEFACGTERQTCHNEEVCPLRRVCPSAR